MCSGSHGLTLKIFRCKMFFVPIFERSGLWKLIWDQCTFFYQYQSYLIYCNIGLAQTHSFGYDITHFYVALTPYSKFLTLCAWHVTKINAVLPWQMFLLPRWFAVVVSVAINVTLFPCFIYGVFKIVYLALESNSTYK